MLMPAEDLLEEAPGTIATHGISDGLGGHNPEAGFRVSLKGGLPVQDETALNPTLAGFLEADEVAPCPQALPALQA